LSAKFETPPVTLVVLVETPNFTQNRELY